jgi:hypothetical protein
MNVAKFMQHLTFLVSVGDSHEKGKSSKCNQSSDLLLQYFASTSIMILSAYHRGFKTSRIVEIGADYPGMINITGGGPYRHRFCEK